MKKQTQLDKERNKAKCPKCKKILPILSENSIDEEFGIKIQSWKCLCGFEILRENNRKLFEYLQLREESMVNPILCCNKRLSIYPKHKEGAYWECAYCHQMFDENIGDWSIGKKLFLRWNWNRIQSEEDKILKKNHTLTEFYQPKKP